MTNFRLFVNEPLRLVFTAQVYVVPSLIGVVLAPGGSVEPAVLLSLFNPTHRCVTLQRVPSNPNVQVLRVLELTLTSNLKL